MWEEYEPDRSYRRKRRYKKRRFLRRCLGLFLIILVILTGMRVKERIAGSSGLTMSIFTNGKVREILLNRDQYPDDLIDLVQGNEEAAYFVLDYPEKKDLPPAETIGDMTPGEIPLLLQWDGMNAGVIACTEIK